MAEGLIRKTEKSIRRAVDSHFSSQTESRTEDIDEAIRRKEETREIVEEDEEILKQLE